MLQLVFGQMTIPQIVEKYGPVEQIRQFEDILV
jgi:hypothetical protein